MEESVMTNDELLWAILAQPDDEAPRLAFAEQLAAQGAAAHAEFIRVQCRLAAHPAEDDAWLEWKIREEELWAELRDGWAKHAELGLRNHAQFKLENFRRGFYEPPVNVTLEELDALPDADARWTFFLRIGKLTTDCHAGAALFASPQLWRVEALDCQRSGVTDAALQACAASPHYARLRELDLSRNSIGPEGVRALLACPSLTGLQALRLNENSLGDAGAQALAEAVTCGTLTQLELFENNLGDAGVAALAGSPHLADLQTLDLRNNPFGAAGVAALADSPHLTRLRTLRLGEFDEDRFGGCIPALRQLYARVGKGFDAWTEYEENETREETA